MKFGNSRLKKLRTALSSSVALAAALGNFVAPTLAIAQSNDTLTPIKHVIVIIGENRTFDHVYATYRPVNAGDKVLNLFSKGIVKADGAPGPNYAESLQYQAIDNDYYRLNPFKAPFTVLPPALTGGPAVPYVCSAISSSFTGVSCDSPANETFAKRSRRGSC